MWCCRCQHPSGWCSFPSPSNQVLICLSANLNMHKCPQLQQVGNGTAGQWHMLVPSRLPPLLLGTFPLLLQAAPSIHGALPSARLGLHANISHE